MDEIEVPPLGTRVEVMSRFTIEWMNNPYRQPTVGIVAHSNPWDKPGTFRLAFLEGMLAKNFDAVFSRDKIEYLKILGTSRDPVNADAVVPVEPIAIKTFQINGSGDNVYTVTLDGEKSSCTCPAGKHGRACKHVKAAQELQAAG